MGKLLGPFSGRYLRGSQNIRMTEIKEVWALAKETATRTKIPARRVARIIFLSTPTPNHRQPAQTNGEKRKGGGFGDSGKTDGINSDIVCAIHESGI